MGRQIPGSFLEEANVKLGWFEHFNLNHSWLQNDERWQRDTMTTFHPVASVLADVHRVEISAAQTTSVIYNQSMHRIKLHSASYKAWIEANNNKMIRRKEQNKCLFLPYHFVHWTNAWPQSLATSATSISESSRSLQSNSVKFYYTRSLFLSFLFFADEKLDLQSFQVLVSASCVWLPGSLLPRLIKNPTTTD